MRRFRIRLPIGRIWQIPDHCVGLYLIVDVLSVLPIYSYRQIPDTVSDNNLVKLVEGVTSSSLEVEVEAAVAVGLLSSLLGGAAVAAITYLSGRKTNTAEAKRIEAET